MVCLHIAPCTPVSSGPVEAEESIPDVGDEGSIVGDPLNRVLYLAHNDAASRTNMTLWRSTDDGQTWGDTATVFAGPSS